jgi:hypothetical protein
MRWRGLFLISLGLNVVLAIGWLMSSRHDEPRAGIDPATGSATIKTNVVIRRQFFSWGEVESTDYPTYIANLREIDCPEQTIRDIIIADVNTLYARRMATELVTAEQQWWRSQPDSNVVRVAAQKAKVIDDERRALLTRLLGSNWETGDLVSLPRPSRPGVLLDGPVLGVLSQETKQAVEEISQRSQERLQAFLSRAGKGDRNEEAAELARLRKQTRDDLARVLSPQQLEEYLLRYSQNANNLRSEMGSLKHFNPTPDEFRAIFRVTDTLDQQIQELAGSLDPNSVLQRNNLEQQRQNAIRQALGPERYNQYVALHDAAYQDAFASAQQSGSPEAAGALYQIGLAAAEEQAAIRANTNLSAAQRAIALKELELRQLTANAQAMGQDVVDPLEEPPAPPLPIDPSITRNVRTHSYVFAVGDTVASIAQRYGVSMNELRAANPALDLRRLQPGDSIRVPDRATR